MVVAEPVRNQGQGYRFGVRTGVFDVTAAGWETRSVPDETQCRLVLEDGLHWVGFGVADEQSVADGRWDSANVQALQTLLRDLGQQVGHEVPVWYVGGMAFDADNPVTPLGDRWPGALWILPRWILWKHSEDCPWRWAVVAKGDDVGTLERGLEAEARALNAWALTGLIVGSGAALAHDAPIAAVSFEQWETQLKGSLTAIVEGSLTKVVMARHEVWQLDRSASPDDLASLFAAIARQAHGTTRMLLSRGANQAVVTATPERLCRFEGLQLQLDALAGSASRDANPSADDELARALLESAKERCEHQLVIDGIQDVLRPWVDTWSFPPEPQVKKLSYIQHLYTPLEATLTEAADIAAIVNALHPTPALGGVPKDAALQLIRDTEAAPRGWYGAPVGVVTAEGAQFWVAIRFAHVWGDRIALMMGAGIVAGSEAKAEWLETARKGEALRGILKQWGAIARVC